MELAFGLFHNRQMGLMLRIYRIGKNKAITELIFPISQDEKHEMRKSYVYHGVIYSDCKACLKRGL